MKSIKHTFPVMEIFILTLKFNGRAQGHSFCIPSELCCIVNFITSALNKFLGTMVNLQTIQINIHVE